MPVVSNTSPIVLLAKIKRLNLLKKLYGTVYIPMCVKVESIDRGKEQGAVDVKEIEIGIKEGWIKKIKLTKMQLKRANRLIRESKIGLGEAEALVIARDKDILAMLDDKEARAIAKSWKIECTSTVMVLYEAFVKGLITYDELVEDLAKLSKVMWVSTDVITEVIGKAREVKR
jgi:predicted nucleic acid-binding protein